MAISEANVAYKLEVLHKPGAVTTVSALPTNSFLTLKSTSPSSLTTGADGDVTEETLQTFTYTQTEYELDSNQKPKKIDFPTVSTTAVSSNAHISAVNSSVIHKENSNSKIETSSALSNTSGVNLNKAGTGFSRTVTETFSFTPSETREYWESSNQNDAIDNAVVMRSDVKIRTSSEVTHDESADKKITALITDLERLGRFSTTRTIKVVGQIGAKYTLIVKNSDGQTYNFLDPYDTSIYRGKEGEPNVTIIEEGFTTSRTNLTNPEITKSRVVEEYKLSLPATATSKDYKIYLELGSGTTASASVPTGESNAIVKSQLADVTLTLSLIEGVGSDWSSISASVTNSGSPGDESYARTAANFTFTATSSGKTGVKNFTKFTSPNDSSWDYYGVLETVAYNYNGAGANVLTVIGKLYVEEYGTSDIAHNIDLDTLITLS